MEREVFPRKDGSGDWVVEEINIEGEGEIYTTIFTGSDPERRAREYAAWRAGEPICPKN